jgi:uncharacterized membrane protein
MNWITLIGTITALIVAVTGLLRQLQHEKSGTHISANPISSTEVPPQP